MGSFIALALAERGYALAVPYRTSAAEAESLVAGVQQRGLDAFAVQVDLTDERAVRDLFESARQRFGRLDVLVNCASIWQAKKLEEVTASDVRAHFDANVLTTFLCSQQAGRIMVAQPEGGCIINFGDWAEVRPYLDYAAYFASKGAMPTLTRCLAHELGSRNPRVRVNCILPGPVLFSPDLPETERQAAIDATLVKRAGQPDDVVQAVLFLVENGFVNGAALPVDGGRSVYASGN